MGVGMNRGLTMEGLASMPLKGLLFLIPTKTASHFKVEDTMIWHKYVCTNQKIYTQVL